MLWCLAGLLSCNSIAATDRTWGGGGVNAVASNPTNWVGRVAPTAGDNIYLDTTTNKNMTWDLNIPVQSWTQVGYAGTVTVATVYGTTGFTNFNITGNCVISNGVWTHMANPSVNYESNRLNATIGGDLIIGSNAAIDVTGKGYAAGYGPGFTVSVANSAAGGSYGGYGYIGGPCYGSITAPTNLGSGGSSSGGGAIQLTVAGNLRNDGLISAKGQNPGNINAGSGGSIYLITGTLTGSGTIQANGGSATGNYGSGGGGRVALVVTTAGADFSLFTGRISTYGGADGLYGGKGAAGTIYLEKQGDSPGKGQLLIDNLGGYQGYAVRTDLNGITAVTCEFSHITLTNGANFSVGSNNTLIVTNTVLTGAGGLSNGIWLVGGTMRTPPTFVYSNLFIGIGATGTIFSPATSLTIGSNATLFIDCPHTMTNILIVAAGGNLSHWANTTLETYKMDLTIEGSLIVQPGGRVDVTAMGYTVGPGSGAGSCGGSYGGRGDVYVGENPHSYGSIVAPTNLGSGGGTHPGGGAIRLNVSGAISNEGVISANGAASFNYGGSGGSVYLTSGTLLGAGTIHANGGFASNDGMGGGGRVALTVTDPGANFSSYTGLIAAYGAPTNTPLYVLGGAGTVYLRTAAQGLNSGTLIIDNGGGGAAGGALSTEISSNVTGTVVGDVLIRNKGYLVVNTNQSLTLSGIWSNAANFDAYSGSRIVFAGGTSSTSTVYGANTFMGLICTNAGKTLLFQAGKTNKVAAYGTLMLGGSGTSPLVLRSTVDNTPWKLNVSSLAGQAVEYVDVKDADAMTGVGTAISALNSTDSGGNTNWLFIGGGQTNVWTGYSNTAWTVSTNWSLGRAPIADDFITIPTAKPRYPTLSLTIMVNGLELQSGASLNLSGYDLTMTRDATLAGTLQASGTETITFQANVDFTGGAITAAHSTVLLAGGGDQSINLANLTFYKVTVLNSVGTVTFANGFTATELRCEAPSNTRNLTFQQGTLVMLRDLILLGAAGNTNITISSSSPGVPWNLAVFGYRSVRGVDVQDSNASSGLPIPATSSQDSSGNVNWTFDVSPSVWLGTSNNNFHTAANWSSGVVPDATTRVLMNTTNPMTITGAVTVLDLTVGGGAGLATGTVNAALTVVENITVLSNGTLILNRPCVVSNSLNVLAGGLATHSANGGTEVNKLNVTVYGSVGVDINGLIDVTGKGYAAKGGVGYSNIQGGGSYGGCGDPYLSSTAPCYGSILAPTNLGSGGGATAGGGAILLTVTGAIHNDGLFCANGVSGVGNGNGSGGSIFLTSGTLTGLGAFRANGGDSINVGAGGGGRMALVVTNTGADFSVFTGSFQAFGGAKANDIYGGAGTIYLQCAANRPGRGTVLVDNNNLANGTYTDVPPSTNYSPGEADRTVFNVTNAARLRLVSNFTVGDIWLPPANTTLNLGFQSLMVHTKQHALGSGTVTSYGAIIWIPDVSGTVFSIR